MVRNDFERFLAAGRSGDVELAAQLPLEARDQVFLVVHQQNRFVLCHCSILFAGFLWSYFPP
jgi:hypothetical protein